MKKYVLAPVIALVLATGAAMAQSSSYQSTATTTAAPATPQSIIPPQPGTLSRTEITKSNDGMGDSTYSRKTTYGNGTASASQSTRTTVTAPPPVQMQMQTKRTTTTTSTSN